MVPNEIIGAINTMLQPYGEKYSESNSQLTMSPADAEHYCGLSSKKLRNMALAGEIRSVRVSRRCVLLYKSDLDSWLAARTTSTK